MTLNDFTKAQQRAINQAYNKALLTGEEDYYKIIYSYKTLCTLNDDQIQWIYEYITCGLNSVEAVEDPTDQEDQELKEVIEAVENNNIIINVVDIIEFYEDIKRVIKRGDTVIIQGVQAVKDPLILDIIYKTIKAHTEAINSPTMGRTSKANNKYIQCNVIKYHISGKTQHEICDIMNLSRGTVVKIINKYRSYKNSN